MLRTRPTLFRLVGAASLVLLLSACVPASAPEVHINNDSSPMGIAVVGEGKVKAAPDQADLTVGVRVTAPDASSASERAAELTSAIAAVLADVGIADDDIATANYDIHPRYEYLVNRTVPAGVELSTQVNVRVTDLDVLPVVIDSVTALDTAGSPPGDGRESDVDAAEPSAGSSVVDLDRPVSDDEAPVVGSTPPDAGDGATGRAGTEPAAPSPADEVRERRKRFTRPGFAAHVTVSSLRFSFSDPAPLLDEARRLAAEDARSRAEALAEASGVELGGLLSLREMSSPSLPPIVYAERATADVGDGSATPIFAGTSEVVVSVEAVFSVAD